MKKINNKILIIVLVVLVGLLVFSKIYRAPNKASNFESHLLDLDTTLITSVVIRPASNRNSEVTLKKEGEQWNVLSKDGKSFEADSLSIARVMEPLDLLLAEKLVSRSQEKWKQFNVGDSSTFVIVFSEGEALAKFHVGNFGFSRTSTGQYGGQVFSYVRLDGSDDVYTVSGFVSSNFNKKLNEWREKTFMRFNQDEVKILEFNYPGDSSFTLTRQDSVWYVGDSVVNFDKVDEYLFKLSNKNIYDIVDSYNPEEPVYRLKVIRDSGVDEIQAYRKEDQWFLKSSLRPDAYFKMPDVDNDIFVTPQKFAKH